MKRCPYCAEDIQDAAVVCKHCGRDLSGKPTPPQVVRVKQLDWISTTAKWGVGIILGVFALGMVLSIFGSDSTPRPPTVLTDLQRTHVNQELKAKDLTFPNSLEVDGSTGFVVATYELSDAQRQNLSVSVRTYGQSRLVAIREALIGDGYKDYRVNVNGPSPGKGLVQRYGSARFIDAGGTVEWITP